jgi:hypothetical protein
LGLYLKLSLGSEAISIPRIRAAIHRYAARYSFSRKQIFD